MSVLAKETSVLIDDLTLTFYSAIASGLMAAIRSLGVTVSVAVCKFGITPSKVLHD